MVERCPKGPTAPTGTDAERVCRQADCQDYLALAEKNCDERLKGMNAFYGERIDKLRAALWAEGADVKPLGHWLTTVGAGWMNGWVFQAGGGYEWSNGWALQGLGMYQNTNQDTFSGYDRTVVHGCVRFTPWVKQTDPSEWGGIVQVTKRW